MRNEQSCPQAPSEAILRWQDLPEYLQGAVIRDV